MRSLIVVPEEGGTQHDVAPPILVMLEGHVCASADDANSQLSSAHNLMSWRPIFSPV